MDDAYLARSLPSIARLDALVAWLTRDVLGKQAEPWLDSVIETNKIASSQQLLGVLAIKWPTLILSESRNAAMAWVSSVVSEDFLLEASPRLFPFFLYQTLLDRQPTPAETKEASEAADESDASARRKLVDRIVASEEYRRSTRRRRLLPNGIEQQAQFEVHGNEYRTLGYRVPDGVPDELFDIESEEDQAERLPLKGFVCARYDGAANRLVTDPNVSLIGTATGGNRFRVERDWIVLGPRVTLNAGDYTIVADIGFEEGSEVTIDLVSAFGTKVLMSLTFSESLRSVIPVKLAERENAVELRLLKLNAEPDVMTLNELGIFVKQPARHMRSAGTGAQSSVPAQRTLSRNGVAAPPPRKGGGLARLLGFGPKDPAKATHKFVSTTGEFDAAWYLDQYPDVRSVGVDPLDHFLKHGMVEGRLPNAQFDPMDYVALNPGQSRRETAFLDYLKERHPDLARKHLP